MYVSLFLCLVLAYLGPVKGISHKESIKRVNQQMLSLCCLWINNNHQDILNTILSLEAKKVSQVLEKSTQSAQSARSARSAWSAFWGDRPPTVH